ncbi:LexA family transcriptional regulator [Morganella morganii]|uniref:LexA family transcriptional regulator n=1 Tax=Morganella morganii TaxID=582 RepID=UPI0033174F26
MIFDNNFPSRVAMARMALNMTQDDLARKVGVVRRQIAAYEGGESKPREKVLANLAASLGTSSEWLSSGKGQSPDLSLVTKTVVLREIPLFHIEDPYFAQFEPEKENATSRVSSFVVSPQDASEYAFAVRILGDSMSCVGSPSFPSGSIVTFEPHKPVNSGDFILFRLDDFVSFKQVIFDQGKTYLSSLNPDYPMFEASDEIRVLGVAIHCQQMIGTMRDSDHAPASSKNKSYGSPGGVESRLDKIESMLERLLKNK